MKAPCCSFAATVAAMSLVCALPLQARAADPDYLDDRSDAAQLVHSLYNAINRKEYGRAWSYYGDAKPGKDFDAFAAGYSNTQRVEVETGAVSTEGAAGSTYYEVPTAIRAVGRDGSEKLFAGCYTARLANSQIQGEDFRPMHIEKGVLKPAEGDLASAVPASCGDGSPPARKDSALERALTIFRTTYGPACETLAADAEPNATESETFDISFKYSYDTDEAPAQKVRLIKLLCGRGAYNSTIAVYYLVGSLGQVRQLQFAEPDLDIRYENDDSNGKVEAVDIIGYRAQDQLVNSSYDPATKTLTSFSIWRGLADASSAGTWIFRDGAFSLVRYDIDASYDGERNPETVVDYLTGP